MGRFPAIETADRAKILAADRPDWFLLDQNWTSSAVPVVYRFLPYGRINAVIATETSVDEFFRHGSCMTARGPLCTDAIFPSHGRHIVAATGRRGRFLRAQRQELLSRSRWRAPAQRATRFILVASDTSVAAGSADISTDDQGHPSRGFPDNRASVRRCLRKPPTSNWWLSLISACSRRRSLNRDNLFASVHAESG